ncbi:MAG TPA: bifunctional phosphoribosylaminoimidazolecarboxamide formyltransferase/IMP cyclohydrolase, partial [Dehalococcoidia bacterium]|nr:bifunctional phosphoribosylaminoimidazolecarboxamide formyltransferase/IMP cyclohydrolase [Dehalococcoidia bacterium]
MRALLAPYDKTGLIEFAQGLVALGWGLIATGNTERLLHEAGLPVTSVAEVIGFPEILDGRLKTLHPAIHGALLARRDKPEHLSQLAEHGIEAIDLVVNNLYPFEATVAKAALREPFDATEDERADLEDALENIDIGGPAMLRAAAKNYASVVVLCDPSDYDATLTSLKDGGVTQETRRALAAKAFQHVALYDTLVARYLRGDDGLAFPNELTIGLRRRPDLDLRYGENPHQSAALYLEAGRTSQGVSGFKQLHGIPMSFNNVLDADAAWRAASDFDAPTIAVVKHMNPCGLASHEDLKIAYERALSGDPISAFGGIVACNRLVDGDLARAMRASVSPSSGQRMVFDIILAPGYSDDALEALTRWRNTRILQVPTGDAFPYDLRRVGGGFLLQGPDTRPDASLALTTASKREPTDEELADLRFAWRVCKHVKSNAIVLVKDRTLLGMGAGQPNRVTSVKLAVERAGERARGSVLASDAYFPFFDGMAVAAAAGVAAAIEPGGSLRDPEVIAIADAAG